MNNIQGENRFGTGPVRDSYIALGHTDLSGDLEAVNGFKHSREYPNQAGIPTEEWGTIGSLRFLLSSNGTLIPAGSGLGANMYEWYAVGLESYGIVDQDGMMAKMMYTGPEIAGGPLHQNASLAWKTGFVARVLNDAWCLRVRCTLRP